jgi:hypothetical protein
VGDRFLSLAREIFHTGKARELKPTDLEALMGRPVKVRDAYEQHTLKLHFDAVGMTVTFHRSGKVTVFPPRDDSLLKDPPPQTASANAPTARGAVAESNPGGHTPAPAAARSAAPKGTAGASCAASNTTRPARPRGTAGSSTPATPKAVPNTLAATPSAPAAPRAAATGQRPAGLTARTAPPPTGIQSYALKRIGWVVAAVLAVFILYVAVKSLEGGPNRPSKGEVREACAGAGAAAEAAVVKIRAEGAAKAAIGMLVGMGIAECPSLE